MQLCLALFFKGSSMETGAAARAAGLLVARPSRRGCALSGNGETRYKAERAGNAVCNVFLSGVELWMHDLVLLYRPRPASDASAPGSPRAFEPSTGRPRAFVDFEAVAVRTYHRCETYALFARGPFPSASTGGVRPGLPERAGASFAVCALASLPLAATLELASRARALGLPGGRSQHADRRQRAVEPHRGQHQRQRQRQRWTVGRAVFGRGGDPGSGRRASHLVGPTPACLRAVTVGANALCPCDLPHACRFSGADAMRCNFYISPLIADATAFRVNASHLMFDVTHLRARVSCARGCRPRDGELVRAGLMPVRLSCVRWLAERA
jgi:hypothetical protein